MKRILTIAVALAMAATTHAQSINLATQVKGQLRPVNGGTGVDTSSSSGCPLLTSGTWTFSPSNCGGAGGINPASAFDVPYYATPTTISGVAFNGIVKASTGTVPSAAIAGTDYTSPAGTENLSNKTITNSTGSFTHLFALAATTGNCLEAGTGHEVVDTGAPCSGGVTFQTNGSNNGSQTLYNLVAGSNVTLINSGGATTVSATAPPTTVVPDPTIYEATYVTNRRSALRSINWASLQQWYQNARNSYTITDVNPPITNASNFTGNFQGRTSVPDAKIRMSMCPASKIVVDNRFPTDDFLQCTGGTDVLYETIISSDMAVFELRGGSPYRIWIDGIPSTQYFNATGHSGGEADSLIRFSDHRPHRIGIQVRNGQFGGFNTPNGSSDLSAPDWPLGPAVAFIGNSLTEPTVTGSFNGQLGFTDVAATLMGWNNNEDRGAGGTDYLNPGSGRTNYIGQLAAFGCGTDPWDGFIFSGGGINDGGNFTSFPTWSSSTAYPIGQPIQFSGATYIALQASTNQNPSTATAYWRFLYTGTQNTAAGEQAVTFATYQVYHGCNPNATLVVLDPVPGAFQGTGDPTYVFLLAGIQAGVAQAKSAGIDIYEIGAPGPADEVWNQIQSNPSECPNLSNGEVNCTVSADGTHYTQVWNEEMGMRFGEELAETVPWLSNWVNTSFPLPYNPASLIQHRFYGITGLWSVPSGGGATFTGSGGLATKELRVGDQIYNGFLDGSNVPESFVIASIPDDNTINLTTSVPSFWSHGGTPNDLQLSSFPWVSINGTFRQLQVNATTGEVDAAVNVLDDGAGNASLGGLHVGTAGAVINSSITTDISNAAITVRPGPGTPSIDFAVQNHAGTANHFGVNDDGSIQWGSTGGTISVASSDDVCTLTNTGACPGSLTVLRTTFNVTPTTTAFQHWTVSVPGASSVDSPVLIQPIADGAGSTTAFVSSSGNVEIDYYCYFCSSFTPGNRTYNLEVIQ